MTRRKERKKDIILTKEGVNEALNFLLSVNLSEEEHSRLVNNREFKKVFTSPELLELIEEIIYLSEEENTKEFQHHVAKILLSHDLDLSDFKLFTEVFHNNKGLIEGVYDFLSLCPECGSTENHIRDNFCRNCGNKVMRSI